MRISLFKQMVVLNVYFLEMLIYGLISAFVALVVLYGLSYYLQLNRAWPKTVLKKQLYQSGETVVPKKRRYLEKTFIWLSYFSTAHVISFMIATMLILTVTAGTIDFTFPVIYFLFTAFAIVFLARDFSVH